jgi:hypothetical protein
MLQVVSLKVLTIWKWEPIHVWIYSWYGEFGLTHYVINWHNSPFRGGGDVKDIRTNAYVIKVGPLSSKLNIDIQFMTHR